MPLYSLRWMPRRRNWLKIPLCSYTLVVSGSGLLFRWAWDWMEKTVTNRAVQVEEFGSGLVCKWHLRKCISVKNRRTSFWVLHAPRSFRVWQLVWQRWQNIACTTSCQTKKKRISKRQTGLLEPRKALQMIQNIAIIRTLSSPSLITKANPTETTITRRNANRSPRQTSGWHGRT